MVANFLIAHAFFASYDSDLMVRLAWVTFGALTETVALCLLGGVLLRTLLGLLTGDAWAYLRRLARWTWWLESARLVLMAVLATHVYTHLKVFMPRLTVRNADALLWEVDRALLSGYSPSVLLLELFRHPAALRAIDWSYHVVFLASIWAVFVLALSSASQRIRVAFVGAKAMMWVVGGWLYYTLPSLGPAYRFEAVWSEAFQWMPYTWATLKALMNNYLIVVEQREGVINFTYGIGAFPSLHVAFQTFLALWVRRFSRLAGAFAVAAAIVVFVGSIVTGWHYLVDSLAGLVLAWLFYAVLFRIYRLDHWIRLFRRFRRPKLRLDRLAAS